MTSLTIALLTPLALLAACGDGIDERYDRHGELVDEDGEPMVESTTTSTTEPRELADITLDHPDTEFEDSEALYSGASSAVQMGDTWFVSGFDNQSDFEQPERGALWSSDDLENWSRIGLDISDGRSQQSIAQLIVVDEWLLAVGADFSREGDESGITDAVVWRSDDNGRTFERVMVERDAGIVSAVLVDGVLWAVGFFDVDGFRAGQLWRSDDAGATWSATDPEASPSPGAPPLRVGPLQSLVEWDGSLIAVGSTATTDPQGGDRLLPTEVYSNQDFGTSIPSDIGIWYSDDGGEQWNGTRPDGLAGIIGTGAPSDAVVVGDHLLIAGSETIGFDPSNFDPSSDDFSLIGTAEAKAWWCDYPLQHCEELVLLPDSFDFAEASLALADNGLVAFAVRGYSFDEDDQGVRLGVLDPASGATSWVGGSGRIEQVEAIAVVDGTIHWFGRDPDTNLMHVASSDLAA